MTEHHTGRTTEWIDLPEPFEDDRIITMCPCEDRTPGDGYVLTVEEGMAMVSHEPCGYPISDYPEEITLANPVPVSVVWESDGCDPPGGWHGVDGRCDCSYYPVITATYQPLPDVGDDG